MIKHSFLVAAASLAAWGGCGDGGGGADAAPQIDARPIDRTERAYVVSRIVLPRSEDDVMASSFEYPGGPGYPVNKLGGLTTVLLDLVEGVPVQTYVDDGITEGLTLNGWIIRSGPLDGEDPAVTAQFVHFEDADDPVDPTDNLTGTGQLRIMTDYGDAISVATLEGGVVEGHGAAEDEWGYDMRLNDQEDPYWTPGIYARMRVTVDEDGFTGATSSVIAPDRLATDVYPSIALLLTRAIQEEVAQAETIRGVYDANGDDVVTVQELVENDTLASLSQPDVDLDGDGVNDHISQGVLVEAVRAEVVE